MVSLSLYISQGARVFLTSWKNRLWPKKFEGNAQQVCEKIVDECWNGRFYQTSNQNFPQFWSRDFGWCVDALVRQGHVKKMHKTLRYALNIFQQHGAVCTTITPKGKAFDFPVMAIDSLPWLIHAIVVSKFEYDNYAKFLNKEIRKYWAVVVSKKTKLVRREKQFSSIKDFAIRDSSCYDNCMVAMLASDLCRLNLENPFIKGGGNLNRQDKEKAVKEQYSELIMQNFWSGEYFYDDLQKKEYVAGDAQLFPIWLGLVNNKEIVNQIIVKVQEEELDKPLPLKYAQKNKLIKFIPQEFFFKDYESDSVWTHIGLLWIKVLQKHKPELAQEYLNDYTKTIEREGAFVEVFARDGKCFKTPFYYCDRTMLWAVNYLDLIKIE
jgi:hypothetical protein